MAATHLAYPDLALDKFSGTDPDQDAESFIQLIERKIIFAVGDAPANPDALANYTFRKKAPVSSLLRGPAAEWYQSNVEAAKLLPPGPTVEQVLLQDFQTAGVNFAIKWK